jgi:mRNA-degrading endonuclease RelE of RelBE toxin-antitoxin system
VLEAMNEISRFAIPLKVIGDTFKPLTGSLKGQWRYRIGDHRLVIRPIEQQHLMDLLAFAARGSIYD